MCWKVVDHTVFCANYLTVGILNRISMVLSVLKPPFAFTGKVMENARAVGHEGWASGFTVRQAMTCAARDSE